MAKTVSAVFDTKVTASDALERLIKHGFSDKDVSLMMSDATRGRDFSIAVETKASEGAAAGATIGGAIGGIAAAMIATGVLAAPGIGLLAAGPLVATLAGLGAGGAVGGVSGALVGLGVPEHEATIINDELKEGAILVGVRAHDDQIEQAETVFKDTGGRSIRAYSA